MGSISWFWWRNAQAIAGLSHVEGLKEEMKLLYIEAAKEGVHTYIYLLGMVSQNGGMLFFWNRRMEGRFEISSHDLSANRGHVQVVSYMCNASLFLTTLSICGSCCVHVQLFTLLACVRAFCWLYCCFPVCNGCVHNGSRHPAPNACLRTHTSAHTLVISIPRGIRSIHTTHMYSHAALTPTH